MDIDGGFETEDILFEILKRLPVKSLLRFMCLSKPWNNLISDPCFVKCHLSFNKQSPSSSYSPHSHSVLGITMRVPRNEKEGDQQFEYFRVDNTNKTTLEHLSIPFPWKAKLDPMPQPKKWRPRHQKIAIIGHCNGLVCALDTQIMVDTSNYEQRRDQDEKLYELERYIICNPITRRFHTVPESDIEVPDLTCHNVNMDTSYYWRNKEFKATGFGSTDDISYSVVQVIYGIGLSSGDEVKFKRSYAPPRVEVYDSKFGTWRKVSIENPEFSYSYEHLHNGVYNSFDGCMYWFGRGYRKEQLYWTLLSFDLVSEKWHETLFPNKDIYWCEDDINSEESVFGEYGVCVGVEILGSSVVMFVTDNRNRTVHSVWKMNKEKDGKMSWTHIYRLCLYASAQGFCRDGELLLRMSWGSFGDYDKLVVYDHKKIDDDCWGITELGFKVESVVPNFVESLVLLEGEMGPMEDALEATLCPVEKKDDEEEEEVVESLCINAKSHLISD